jgi:hypothetical protein
MQAAHGLYVRSTVPLPGLRPCDDDAEVDLDVRWQPSRTVPDDVARDDVMLRCVAGGRLRYSAAVSPEGYHLRFNRCCQFDVDVATRTVAAHMHPGVAPELGAIIAAGSLLSFVLTLRGHTVLHASAVETAAGAVAITGPSGSGKSTVAALACAAGLSLITDDVLRVDLSSDLGPTVTRGAEEIRLRPASRDVIAQFDVPVPTRDTTDGRLAVHAPVIDGESMPLVAVVLPRPRRDRAQIAVRRLSTKAAMVQLLAMPRLLGWEAAAILQRQFDDLAELVRRIPVVELDVPWGPPFAATLGRQLGEQLVELAAGAALGRGTRGSSVGQSR